jgi:hypothetical protein
MRYIIAVLSVIIFGIFIRVVPPTIYLGDSGEIVAGAYTLGISHPPGYALYMLLAKAFITIFRGDPALMMNIMSSALGVLVFIALYNLIAYILLEFYGGAKGGPARLAALGVSLMFVFSYIFWFNASNAKGGIYMLTLLAEVLAMYYCARFIRENKPKYFMLTLYLAGLLPALHHSASLAMIFIAGAAVVNMRQLRKDVVINSSALLLLPLFLPYLYLFIRVAAKPAVWWSDIHTAAQIFGHIIRKVYLSNPDVPLNYDSFIYKLKSYAGQFAFCYKSCVLFFFAGLYSLYRGNRRVFTAAFAFLLLDLLALLVLTRNSMYSMNIYTNAPYYLFMDVVAAVIMAIGVFKVAVFLRDKYRLGVYPAMALFMLVPAWNAADNYLRVDASDKFLGYDQPLNILRNLKSGDSYFAEEDFDIFGMMYIRQVKHMYPNINVYDRTGNFLDKSIYRGYMEAREKFSYGRSPMDDYGKTEMEVVKMLRLNAELNVTAKNPDGAYFSDPTEFPQKDLLSMPYGMVNKIYKRGAPRPDAEPLLRDAVIRDYFNNSVLDLYYRDVLARYFVQRARFEALDNRMQSFDVFKNVAEYIAGDSGAVLNRIAYIYYFDLNDHAAAVTYMEKIMHLNPFDYNALNVLISFCLQTDMAKAMYWLKYFYNIAPTPELQNEILIQIRKIEDMMSKGVNNGK